ncbi:hypothetical protein BS78_01G154300 [Paspalum vaginatum]|nr:hypothetical protein BS78_01G154300 [Paspalum vaginatum]
MQMPTPASSASDPLQSAARPRRRCRTREVSSRYLATPLPTQPPRLSTSSSHSTSTSTPMPPSTIARHHRPPATATFVFGLADENRPPPTPGSGSRKRGAAPDLLDVMHRQRQGPVMNPPAAAVPTPRRALGPSRAAANAAATPAAAHRHRGGGWGGARPSTPARTTFCFSGGASPGASAAAFDLGATPAFGPRRAPCSELRSSLTRTRTEGSGQPPGAFCFRALRSALPDCQAKLPAALVKQPPQPAHKAVMVSKGAAMGGNKAAGKQEDVHQLRVLDNRYMQYRFLNAQAEAVAVAKNAAAEKALCGLLERLAGLQESVAQKKSELEHRKRVEKVCAIVDAQVPFLEQWGGLDREHSSCLAAGTAALLDAASHVPILGNIRINNGGVKEALKSAMEIMKQMSPCSEKLSGKVEECENVASELTSVVAREKVLLQECADLLHQAHAMQVMENSLRIEVMHLKNQPRNTP